MDYSPSESGRLKWWQIAIVVLIAILLVVLFWPELISLFYVAKGVIVFITGGEFPIDTFTPYFWQGLYFLVFGFICYQVGLYVISLFLLPATDSTKRKKIHQSFRDFRKKKLRKPDIVENGQLQIPNLEKVDVRPTVALVDLCSAIVYEKRVFPGPSNSKNKQKSKKYVVTTSVYGPGINFIKPGEKLLGAVDLRMQFRLKKEFSAKTCDPIQITTDIYVIFTIGEEPEELLVTFTDYEQRDLRVIEVGEKWTSDGSIGRKQFFIKEFKPALEVDLDDQAEMKHFHQRWKSSFPVEYDSNFTFNNKNESSPSPFTFHQDRARAAIFSQANFTSSHSTLHWTEIPCDIAGNIFRDELSTEYYDELYKPEDPHEFPLRNFRQKFSRKVRNQGILSYRIVERSDGLPVKVGDIWEEAELLVSPKQLLKQSKILRERGIKVVAAGFTQLIPDEKIQQQLFDYWQARWEKKREYIKAQTELDEIRIRTNARVEAQKAMGNTLTQIFDEKIPHSKEALAIRLLQALEVAATDPETKKLLPRETINMLWNLRQWLIPEAKSEQQPPGQ